MTDQARAAYEARYQCDANDPMNANDLALFVAGYEAASGTNAPLYDPRDVAFGAVAAHGAQSAPAGFVMVPVEPTPEMVAAAFEKVELNGAPGFATGNEARRAIYSAMLAAAPAQPAAGLVGLTESDLMKCLRAAGCYDTIKVTYESGPYCIDLPTNAVVRLTDAAIRTFCQKNNLPTERSDG